MKSSFAGLARLAQEEEQTNQRFRVCDLLRTRSEVAWYFSQRRRGQSNQLVRIDLTACRLAISGVEDRHPLVRVARRGVIRRQLRQPAGAITRFLDQLPSRACLGRLLRLQRTCRNPQQ